MADICVLVEGAYPFVAGGVSSWLHALITNLPEFSFAVVHLSSLPDPDRAMKYQLPPNVVEFRELFIHATDAAREPPAYHRGAPEWATLRDLHARLAAGDWAPTPDLARWLAQPDLHGFAPADLFAAPEAWQIITERYAAGASDAAFVEYFWTFRYTHLPLFTILRAEVPAARAYHAVSAGFNGYLGALAARRTGRPLLITEHGIYVREREIEIAQAEWIARQTPDELLPGRRLDFFQTWWLDMFRYMTRMAYDAADTVISITATNQRYQLRDGAAPDKLRLIPNGVDVARFATLRQGVAPHPDRFVVGFVGRVVSIKDVKTFIRAVNLARTVIPGLEAAIIGPEDEEDDYAAECHALVRQLDLERVIQFTGPADVRDWYRTVDCLALTSLSEGQPLVILEGGCAGVPIVASDVGACRELLEGGTVADQRIGPSGLVTPPASPQATADALIRLWRDPDLRQRLGRAGQERVFRFYREEDLYATYRALYRQAVDAPTERRP